MMYVRYYSEYSASNCFHNPAKGPFHIRTVYHKCSWRQGHGTFSRHLSPNNTCDFKKRRKGTLVLMNGNNAKLEDSL